MNPKQSIELWDAYYPDGTLAGCDLIRGEKIPDGLRHAVAEVFVMHRDGDILLMQRDLDKPNYPGLWESGAGGSVLKGESVIDGARRELLEETGITADEALESLYYTVSDTTIYRGYLCVTDIPKDSIKLQKGETIAFRWVSKQEFREIFYSDRYVDGLRERLHEFVEHDFQINLINVTQNKIKYQNLILQIILNIAIALFTVIAMTGVFFYFNGSLELYPTEEQIEKVKIASAVITLVSLAIDICLIKCRRKLKL